MISYMGIYKVTLVCIAISLAVTIVASSPAAPVVRTSETLHTENANALSTETNPGQAQIDLDTEIPVDDNFHRINNKAKRESDEMLQPEETFWRSSGSDWFDWPDWGYYRRTYLPVWRKSTYRRWWPASRTQRWF